MNIELEKAIIKPSRSKMNGELIKPKWFVKYGRYLQGYNWDTIITYRPAKLKIKESNSERLFRRLVDSDELGINFLWWALEPDSTGWNHAHLLTSGGKDLTKHKIAETLKRSISEIGYFDKPNSQKAVSNYCSKYLGIDNIKGYGFINKY